MNEINRPKISVILPVYNVEKYLKKCIDSLIHQTLKDIEIIFVNDGSTDNSLDILERCASKDERCIIINQENQGQGVARNKGIEIAKGEYLQFIDPDDWVELDMLEKLYIFAKKNDSKIVQINYKNYNEYSGKITDSNLVENFKKKLNYDIDKMGFYSWSKLEKDNFLCLEMYSWLYMYSADFIKSNNIRFGEGRLGEDQIFVISSVLLADRVDFLNEYFYYHRQREGSAVYTKSDLNFCIFDNLLLVKKFLIDRNFGYELENIYPAYSKQVIFSAYNLIPQKSIKRYEELSLQYYGSIKELKNDLKKSRYKRKRKFLEQIFSLKGEMIGPIKYKAVCILGMVFYIEPKRKDKGKNFLDNLFSIEISEDKIHKLITIFGIRLSIKKAKYSRRSIKLGDAKYLSGNSENILPKTNINVVFCIDDNYIRHCAVTIISILANSSYENFYNFYVLSSGLKPESVEKLKSLAKLRDFSINFIDIGSFDFSRFPLNRDWISVAAYYRLLLPEVLPENIDKCIYMDCDTIIEDDLAILWNYNIENYLAGVVEDECSKPNVERLGLDPENNYFNSGMVLFNIRKLREFDLFNRSIEYFNKNSDIITLQDQDILNGVLNGKCLFLPLRWNVNSTVYKKWTPENRYYTSQDEDVAALNPGLLHFTSIPKPWDSSCKHLLCDEYQRYSDMIKL